VNNKAPKVNYLLILVFNDGSGTLSTAEVVLVWFLSNQILLDGLFSDDLGDLSWNV